MSEPDLFNRVEPIVKEESRRWPIAYLPLNAPDYRWLGMGYSKHWGYSETAVPTMVVIAGSSETTMYELKKVAAQVAKAARCGTPDVALDWSYLADWLQAGARPSLICTAIDRQIKQMGDRYQGVKSLKLFNRAVLDALAREQARE